MGSMSAYQAGGTHRHTPEIEQALSAERSRVLAPAQVTLSFTPTLAPMSRGILATCTARSTATASELRAALAAAYGPEPFVHLLPEGRWPATGAIFGSNAAHLQVAADPHAGRATVVCALDNLVKGAAGQAIQIANLMLGLPEIAGLTAHGVTP
jgi:N-acetyl-gamma-glutamyl-phosphate reductase